MSQLQQYFAGKSQDTWFQKPPTTRLVYKLKLIHTRDKKRAKCNRCQKWFKIVQLTIDHICPISKGGHVDDLGNMQLLCDRCHNRKTIMDKKGVN